jgi:hypothetical protein
MHLGGELAGLWLVELVDTIAVDVELPAVVRAADALLLIATEEEGCGAVRAGILDQRDLARRDAKTDQVFAEQAQAHWRTVRLRHLLGEQRRHPILT